MRKAKLVEELSQIGVISQPRSDVTEVPRHIKDLHEERSHTIADKEEIVSEIANGNGDILSGLWELTLASPTYHTAEGIISSATLKELTDTRFKLDKAEKENQQLAIFKESWLLNQYDCEALVTSDDDAMVLLANFVDKEALPISTITRLIAKSTQWMSLVRLAEAKLIRCLGSYIYLTERGKQILDAVLERDSSKLDE